MTDKEKKVAAIISALKSIEIVLEDNNQNLKDCKRQLQELKKEFIPRKESWIEKIFKRTKI